MRQPEIVNQPKGHHIEDLGGNAAISAAAERKTRQRASTGALSAWHRAGRTRSRETTMEQITEVTLRDTFKTELYYDDQYGWEHHANHSTEAGAREAANRVRKGAVKARIVRVSYEVID